MVLQLGVIVDLELLLAPSGGIRDVELKPNKTHKNPISKTHRIRVRVSDSNLHDCSAAAAEMGEMLRLL